VIADFGSTIRQASLLRARVVTRLEEQFFTEVDHVNAGRADVAVAPFAVEFRPIETDAFAH
jgi:hypothetical protein